MSARFLARFSILHPSFPGSLLFLTTLSPRNPSQGKTTTTKSRILPQQRCEAFVEIRFFLFQSQKNQGWKREASKGLRAHLFPKKTSLNSPINHNFVAAAGDGGERILLVLHSNLLLELVFPGEKMELFGGSLPQPHLISGWERRWKGLWMKVPPPSPEPKPSPRAFRERGLENSFLIHSAAAEEGRDGGIWDWLLPLWWFYLKVSSTCLA